MGNPLNSLILAWRTSLADTKNTRCSASERVAQTFSSSTKKSTVRNKCCLLTWRKRILEKNSKPHVIINSNTLYYLFEKFGLRSWRVPSVVQYKNIGFWQAGGNFEKEIFFLKRLIENRENFMRVHFKISVSTVNIKVDSEFATNTNTSASKQCLSIHESKLGETSIPGESTRTTSSRSKGHLSVGQ